MAQTARSYDGFEARRDIIAAEIVCRAYARGYQQLHIHTPCPLPVTGPAVVAANHTAGLDPIMVQATSPRRIVWIMTADYYDLPSMRWFFRWAQMIRIDQAGRDSTAWRTALRCLKQGLVVGVFPEGRIERTDDLLPFQTGVTLMAARGGADLYPVYLDGLQRRTGILHTYLEPQHPSIAWGEPIRLPPDASDRNALDRLTADLQSRIELMRHHYPAPRRKGRSPLR